MKGFQGIRLVILLAMVLLLPWVCLAADETANNVQMQNQVQKKSPLSFDVGLYFWGASIASSVDTSYGDISVDYSLSDILKDLKMSATGTITVNYNDWYALADIVYLNVKPDATDTISIVVDDEGDEYSVDVNLSGTADVKMNMDTLVIGKRFDNKFPLSVFAGIRYISSKVDMEVNAAAINLPPPYNEPYHYSDTEKDEWIVGTIGAEIKAPLTKNFGLSFTADIGFGDRDFEWEVLPLIYYQFNEIFSVAAGYRVVDIYHDRQDFKLSMAEQGPIIGVDFSF